MRRMSPEQAIAAFNRIWNLHGITVILYHGDQVYELRGIAHNDTKNLIRFIADVPIDIGDRIQRKASGQMLTVVRVDPEEDPEGTRAVFWNVYYETDNDREIRTQQSGPAISIGSVHGSIFNVQSHLNNTIQHINTATSMEEETRREFAALVKRLQGAFMVDGNEDTVDAQIITTTVETVVEELNSPKPDKKRLKVSAEGLAKAAGNIAAIAPTVIPVIQQIISFIDKLPK